MNDPYDSGIPPPPPPPLPPVYGDDGAFFGGQSNAGQGGDDPFAQASAQGAQAQAVQTSNGNDGNQGGQVGAHQYTNQYDQTFAHAPYDQNQAAQQGGYGNAYTQDGSVQGAYAQPIASSSQYGDPYAFDAQQAATQGGPQGGYDPMMGPPMGGSAGTPPPGAPPPPPKPSKPANFQLGTKLSKQLKIKIPPHNLQFDEPYFLSLLAGSISLTKEEKKRIIESMPKLRQSQVDELIRIFEEEKEKFAELGEEHVSQLEKLATQHYEDWIDIEMSQEQQSKASQDEAQAEEIRKQLGI